MYGILRKVLFPQVCFLIFFGVLSNYGSAQPDSLLLEKINSYKSDARKNRDIDPWKSISSLDSAISLTESYKLWDDYFNLQSLKFDQYLHMDVLGNCKQTLDFVDSLLLLTKFQDLAKSHTASQKVNWGFYYETIGFLQKATNYFEQSIDYIKQTSDLSDKSECFNIYRTNLFIGNISTKVGQYQKALDTYKANIHYFECASGAELESKSPNQFALNYKLIGDAYLKKGDRTNALSFYKLAEDDLEAMISSYVGRTWYFTWAKAIYHALATYHLSSPKVAESYINKSKKFHFGPKDLSWIKTYTLLSQIHQAMKDYPKSENALNQALTYSLNQFGDRFYGHATIYLALGRLKALQQAYDETLSAYQQAIINLSKDFSHTDPAELPMLNQVIAPKDLLEVLDARLEALLSLHQATKEEQYLHMGRNTAVYAIELIDHIRDDFWLEADKQHLVQLSYDVYEKGIRFAQLSGKDYFAQGFWMAEKSKALTLLEAYHNANIRDLANVDPAVLERETSLRYEISYLEEQFKNEQIKEEQDAAKLASLLEELEVLRKEFVNIQDQINKEHAQFAQLNTAEVLSLQEVQAQLLDKQKSLLEYFVGDEYAYVFVINKNNIDLVSIPNTQDLQTEVEMLRDGLYGYFLDPSPTDSLYQAKNKYLLQAAHQLYRQLLEPVQNQLRSELILIPDGILNYIPFGVLLEDETQPENVQFTALSYFLKQHNLNYCYSASLLGAMQGTRQNSGTRLLAFAPSFPPDPAFPENALATRGNLGPLFHNIEEVEAISSILGNGNVKTREEASITNFEQLATRYDILHIASHGIMNDSASDYSFIAFTEDEGERRNKLYVKDLYNMQLKADMVVLSACETGIGELKRGEGLLSIARGFSYAGAKSIITTLWSVNDKSTTEIIREFYSNLEQGKSKSAALRAAKLDYLNKQIDQLDAHPFFWAAYVSIGNEKPLGTSYFWYWSAGGLLLLIVGIIIWSRNRSPKAT